MMAGIEKKQGMEEGYSGEEINYHFHFIFKS